MAALKALLARDLSLAFRRGADTAMGLVFFVVALSLFPFGVGASPDILARIGAGVIWVVALLAVLLTLDRLWQADFEDGSLELILLSPAPLELLVVVKCLAHWLTSGLLLVVASPLLALLMNLPTEGWWALPLALLLGTPTLTLIGSIGAALLLGSRRGSVLIALLVLPLYVPVLIFGVAAVEGVLMGLSGAAPLLILGAILLAALALTPFATAAALRLALE
ncbi:heme exporter protein CcmB [Benzoatithermus flavus]|uniref:Heme exporter protein B n=1 Tax=Benzoatithermus flavus TaxID=3108223 RepID=A0ABU8XV99_9PROT